jgi:hypothetical protein
LAIHSIVTGYRRPKALFALAARPSVRVSSGWSAFNSSTTIIAALRLVLAVATVRSSLEAFGDPAA